MKIPVVGFDPSMRAWGMAEAMLDLTTGILDTPKLTILEPDKIKNKQVRVNSIDTDVAKQLAADVFKVARRAKVIFVEPPVGSQSASGMKAYGIVIGILGSLRAHDIQFIEVTALEVKKALTGNKNASKLQMIEKAYEFYPEANFPRYVKSGKTFKKGDIADKAEHAADALGAIHAGVLTPMFQNLMKLYI